PEARARRSSRRHETQDRGGARRREVRRGPGDRDPVGRSSRGGAGEEGGAAPRRGGPARRGSGEVTRAAPSPVGGKARRRAGAEAAVEAAGGVAPVSAKGWPARSAKTSLKGTRRARPRMWAGA